jgi:hypothetical protein
MVGQGVVRFPDGTLAFHPSRGFPTKKGFAMSVTPLDLATRRPAKQKPAKTRKPFRTETPGEPVFVAYGDGPARPVINGRARARFELADMRRREVLERNLQDAMRRRALHRRTGNFAAYRKADEQAGRYMDLIVAGIDAHRWGE